MSHIQVLTVEPTTLTRTLRLTGAVAYNSFHTTPVITQVSGPVSRIAVVPGQSSERGQPLLYVASPDYSQLLSNYLKARDAYRARAESLMPELRTFTNITQLPSRIWSRRNRPRCRPKAI